MTETPVWLKRAGSKKIGVTELLIITATALSLSLLHIPKSEDVSIGLIIYRFGIMLPLLCIRALLSNNYAGIEDKMQYVGGVAVSKMPVDTKKDIIRRNLEAMVSRWVRYWREFQTIVLADYSVTKKWEKIKALAKKIREGEITWSRLILICMYIFYGIIISTNVLNIPGPWDVMINVGFLALYFYATGDIIGLFQVLLNFFNAIAPGGTEAEYQTRFAVLEDNIKDNCNSYYYMNSQSSKNTSNGPMVYQGQFIDKEVHLDNLKELQKGIETTKPTLNHEIAKLEVEIEKEKLNQKSIEPIQKT